MVKPTIPPNRRSSDDPAIIDAAIARIVAAIDSADGVSYRRDADGTEHMRVCSLRTLSWSWVRSFPTLPFHTGDPT